MASGPADTGAGPLAAMGAAETIAGTVGPALASVSDAPAIPVGSGSHLERLSLVGAGGMGEVWRARDHRLGCDVALKTLRSDLASHAERARRFVDEARLTARLQHPGVVAVHEIGALEDGRPYYTMALVGGVVFDAFLAQTRLASDVRRRVQVVLQVADAVGFAHAQGVIHRDLKPENVRVGDHGEVIVLDWGVATDKPAPGPPVGTAAYIAPELLDHAAPSPRSDVFSLGRMLERVAHGATGPDAASLRTIAASAVARSPDQRPANAAVLAEALRGWLDGAQRRSEALASVAEADAVEAELAAQRSRGAALEAELVSLRASLRPWEVGDRRNRLWAVEDALAALVREERLARVRWRGHLHAALARLPDLADAHVRLASAARRAHESALEARDDAGAGEAEALLTLHDRGDHRRWLAGRGELTLRVPEGARVRLERLEERELRRVVVDEVEPPAGSTLRMELPSGSWRARVEVDGAPTVLHPIWVPRDGTAIDRAPGAEVPPVIGPPPGPWPDDAVWITPGWSRFAGDPGAANQPDACGGWVDGVWLMRTPVTNRAWLEFLHALLDKGDEAAALRCAPQERTARPDVPGRMVYAWDGRRFSLAADREGDRWELDWPVVLVDHAAALTYAAWRSARDGIAWRLPDELEWERAARGADGRFHPWGDRFDPTFCRNRLSYPDGVRPSPAAVGAYPDDTSPFGVLDLAGNVRTWCTNVWGGETEMQRNAPVVRGGSWSGHPQICRSATRTQTDARVRGEAIGVRLAADPGPRGG